MRLHVVGLPHTKTRRDYNGCAYTAKVFKFCQMMSAAGDIVYHYGAEGSDPPCSQHVEVISDKMQRRWFGDYDAAKLPAVKFDAREPYWQSFNARTAAAIIEAYEPGDYICLIGGVAQEPIAEAMPANVIVVEFGIGYRGVLPRKGAKSAAPRFRVYESYAQMHVQLGGESADPNGFAYDAVIPNYFDVNDFEFQPTPEDYLLYLGRVVHRKGVGTAVAAAKAAGKKLKIAGAGVASSTPGRIVAADGSVYEGDHLEYVGPVDIAARNQLMRNASALLLPTIYVEPFGGVAVESQLCGTPAITTDWGAFPETVAHGETGYRCHTLEHFVWAAKNVSRLNRQAVRDRAVRRYSLESVAGMYVEYFDMLDGLWSGGWPDLSRLPARDQLDWLNE